MPAAVGLIIQ